MKKLICGVLAVMMLLGSCSAFAGGWEIPDNHASNTTGAYKDRYYSVSVKLKEDLATRSGPSTEYTGCGSYSLKGQYVTALKRAFDRNGVLWVLVEFSYGGGIRRAWTGAKRLEISDKQLSWLEEEDGKTFIGYGTVNKTSSTRMGPGTLFAPYKDRDYRQGDRVAVVDQELDYYLVESYYTNKEILRSWIPVEDVNLD